MVIGAAFSGHSLSAAFIIVGGAMILLRQYGWAGSHTLGQPILWVLQLGWACIGLGLIARGFAILVPGILTPSIATHVLTIGGIGVLTLGMMCRVSLGHTGRELALPSSAVVAIVLLVFAILARVGTPLLVPAWYVPGLIVAASLWAAAFALFLSGYFVILISPRVDGRPG
jgi:uncharacterized protein involved in response to NO